VADSAERDFADEGFGFTPVSIRLPVTAPCERASCSVQPRRLIAGSDIDAKERIQPPGTVLSFR